jgi:hypothetical protein
MRSDRVEFPPLLPDVESIPLVAFGDPDSGAIRATWNASCDLRLRKKAATPLRSPPPDDPRPATCRRSSSCGKANGRRGLVGRNPSRRADDGWDRTIGADRSYLADQGHELRQAFSVRSRGPSISNGVPRGPRGIAVPRKSPLRTLGQVKEWEHRSPCSVACAFRSICRFSREFDARTSLLSRRTSAFEAAPAARLSAGRSFPIRCRFFRFSDQRPVDTASRDSRSWPAAPRNATPVADRYIGRRDPYIRACRRRFEERSVDGDSARLTG